MTRLLDRRWVFVLLLYIGLDFLDPSVPGVFFLDNEALFMDGLVQAKESHDVGAAVLDASPYPHRLGVVIASRPTPPTQDLSLRPPPRHRVLSFPNRSSSLQAASPDTADDH
jgi:hypothetical protein